MIYTKSVYALDVSFHLWGDSSNGKAQIHAKTNLPEGTILSAMLVSPINVGGNGKIAENNLIVDFEGNVDFRRLYNPLTYLNSGNYVLNIGIMPDHLQPKRVLNTIGKMGENLKGEHIITTPFGRMFDIGVHLTAPQEGEVIFKKRQQTQRTQPTAQESHDTDSFEMLKHSLKPTQELIKQLAVAVRCGVVDELNGNFAIGQSIAYANQQMFLARLSPEKSVVLDKITRNSIQEGGDLATKEFCLRLNPAWKGQIQITVRNLIANPF